MSARGEGRKGKIERRTGEEDDALDFVVREYRRGEGFIVEVLNEGEL